jgi:hypothetical protein
MIAVSLWKRDKRPLMIERGELRRTVMTAKEDACVATMGRECSPDPGTQKTTRPHLGKIW